MQDLDELTELFVMGRKNVQREAVHLDAIVQGPKIHVCFDFQLFLFLLIMCTAQTLYCLRLDLCHSWAWNIIVPT